MRPPALGPLPPSLLLLPLLAALAPTASAARGPLPEMPDYVFVVGPDEENLDVVVFGESRPALIRFRARINDRGFRTAWDDFACRLFDYLDDDGDRVLTLREARRGRWVRLFTDALDEDGPAPDATLSTLDSDPKDGKVSVAELSRYLREALGQGALGTQGGNGPDRKAQAAFTQLDLDGDGGLSPSELAAAEGLLARLDADDDEVISLAELRPHDNPYADRFGNPDPGPPPVEPESGLMVPLTSADVRQRVARRIKARYAGTLDPGELGRLVDEWTPGLILDVRLGRLPRPVTTIALAGPDGSQSPGAGPGPLAAKVKKTPENGFVLDLDGLEVRIDLNDAVRDFRNFFGMRFDEADADKDGALDKAESDKSRIFGNVFEAADRNADQKLSKRELIAYLDRSVDAAESRLMLTAADSGRNLFGLLDGDRDDRLSRRELRGAAARLKPYDRDGDGRIALAEVPRSYQLGTGRGPFSRRRGLAFETYDSPPPGRPGARGDEVSWFRHMDRNRDGDVSPREFLGPLDDFRKIDADGDGLIDPKEAAKGP